MQLKLNDICAEIEGSEMSLTILPEQVTDGLDVADNDALRRHTIRLDPESALAEALAVLRDSERSDYLRALLDAVDAIRRDLVEWAEHGKACDAGQRDSRPLTDDERRRIAEVVGGTKAEAEAAIALDDIWRPSPAIPAQDSGEALVGVECEYSYDGMKWYGRAICDVYCMTTDAENLPYRPRDGVSVDGDVNRSFWFRHARPVALGRPS